MKMLMVKVMAMKKKESITDLLLNVYLIDGG